MVRKIKIYSDPTYCVEPDNYIPLLVPFWGMWKDNQYWEQAHFTGLEKEKQMDAYMAAVTDYFQMVEVMEEADVVMLPSRLMKYFSKERQDLVYGFAAKAAEAQKRILLFNNSDFHVSPGIDNAIILGSSLYQSRRQPNEFGVTSWIPDYFEGETPPRKKGEKPVVGFCGQVTEPSFMDRYIKHVGRWLLQDVYTREIGGMTFRRWDNFKHKFLRYDGLTYLQESPQVVTDFIFRESYYGNAIDVHKGEWETDTVQSVREDYLDNMSNTDYTFCARGKGNFSFRFYEILSAGRIPLYIDTDTVLPYDFAVNWREQFFWIDVDDLPQVGERLYDYHRGLTDEQFQDVQRNCRHLWEEWLSPRGFCKNFYRYLDAVQV